MAAKGRSQAHYLLGVPTVLLSATVGTSLFTSLGNYSGDHNQLVFGLLSIIAATLAALQTFLDFEGLSSKHRSADSGYSAIRQRIEEMEASPPATRTELLALLSEIRSDIERLTREAPLVPERYWKHARSILYKKPEELGK
jgi:hypothetical protein